MVATTEATQPSTASLDSAEVRAAAELALDDIVLDGYGTVGETLAMLRGARDTFGMGQRRRQPRADRRPRRGCWVRDRPARRRWADAGHVSRLGVDRVSNKRRRTECEPYGYLEPSITSLT